MGIPAAFRWLSTRYPRIISSVVEEQPVTMDDGTVIPVDCTSKNPNGEEFDNLYLDMNGIVHPCTHPEDRPAPKNEAEMMLEIFRYTDRVIKMVRPRKILMIAIDGVAPRAKMNQQRSRRFRSAQEAEIAAQVKQEQREKAIKANGGKAPPQSAEEVVQQVFDSNTITPGTPFMDVLAKSLRYWCTYKLSEDPAWVSLKVIISDASVPGEGEHKIMEFIRSQRSSPDHDPNTRHVIYGLDADLIMLGLATHEPYFRVLREDVFFQETRAKTCVLCGKTGHDPASCTGRKDEDGDKKVAPPKPFLKPFIWLHVNVLREYLELELKVEHLPFPWSLERAIDDWVFLFFFVGNDFLPHLPALEIREHGIDTLTKIWRNKLPSLGDYITKNGDVNLDKAQVIFIELGKEEDNILRRKRQQDERREANNKRRKLEQEAAKRFNHGPAAPTESEAHSSALLHNAVVNGTPEANRSAASLLRSKIQAAMNPGAKTHCESSTAESKDSVVSNGSATDIGATDNKSTVLGKRKAPAVGNDETVTKPPVEAVDEVRLGDPGYENRYYAAKFKVDPNDIEFRHKVARSYMEGVAWVLRYYFQGCPSWDWFYPYHYAPFAKDFVDVASMKIDFQKGRISLPYEQLMSVLPAASRAALPSVFHDLMTRSDSPIIDFYPEKFETDLNGQKAAWKGVVLLPFIDMPRLLEALKDKYTLLSDVQKFRNTFGHDVLMISADHPSLYPELSKNLYTKSLAEGKYELDPKTSDGLSGTVIKRDDDYIPHTTVKVPFEHVKLPLVEHDQSLSVWYEMPALASHKHKSVLLPGVQLPEPVLTEADKMALREKSVRGGYRGGRQTINHDSRHRGGFSYNNAGHSNAGHNDNGHYNGGWRNAPPPAPGMPGAFNAGFPFMHRGGGFGNHRGNPSYHNGHNGGYQQGYGHSAGGYSASHRGYHQGPSSLPPHPSSRNSSRGGFAPNQHRSLGPGGYHSGPAPPSFTNHSSNRSRGSHNNSRGRGYQPRR